jgi:NAD(P)-dependent dehydrogenase (short-subunit alcohol dehydrogenase family)
MDTNFFGMAATFSPFIGAMRRAGRGRLVGIASVAGIRGLPGSEAYSASKAAAISYLESLRLELRGFGRQGGHPLSRLHPHADDRVNPLPDAFPDSGRPPRRALRGPSPRAAAMSSFPGRWALVAKLLRLLPNALYDRLMVAGVPRKPRGA